MRGDAAGRHGEWQGDRRLFRDRELIIRSDGRVVYFRLTRGHQIVASAILGLMIAWGAAATGGAVLQQGMIAEKRQEISEAKLAYGQLRQDLDSYRSDMAQLTQSLSRRAVAALQPNPKDAAASVQIQSELQALAGLNRSLDKAFRLISTDLDIPSEESGRIIASRRALNEEIELLQQNLVQARIEIAALSEENRMQAARVDEIHLERVRSDERRDAIARRAANLEKFLSESRGESGALTEEIDDLETVLARVNRQNRAAADKERDLRDRIAGLENALQQARARGDGLATGLASVRRKLGEEQERLAEITQERDGFSTQAARLQGLLQKARLDRRKVERTLAGLVDDLAALEIDPPPTLLVSAAPNIEDADVVAELKAMTKGLSLSLKDSRDRQARIEGVIDDLLETLTVVAGEAVEGATLSDDPVDRTEALVSSIGALHEEQRAAVAELTERADAHIARAERALTTAGLGPVELQTLGIAPEKGQGGPFFAMDFAGGAVEELEVSVATLAERAERLATLEDLMACAPWISPVDHYHLTSKFGKRKDPFNGRMAMHKGIDLAGWPRTPVYASAPGEVSFAGVHGRYGRMVEIDHGCGIRTRYGHLRKIIVKKGETVGHRDQIGTLGSTGRSTGPHVHYEIRINGEPVDPLKFIEAGRYFYKS
ncbi:MAG: peptidoglycan DD-metalloendopeptidase family protein [Alphaproteobacteria bacterium]|nr:peptidoglycan DD-metalloendopeptidase family protein [Alphaproteobacteria bacterium]